MWIYFLRELIVYGLCCPITRAPVNTITEVALFTMEMAPHKGYMCVTNAGVLGKSRLRELGIALILTKLMLNVYPLV